MCNIEKIGVAWRRSYRLCACVNIAYPHVCVPLILIAEVDRFVDVEIMPALGRVICTFRAHQSTVQEKTCSIFYGPMGSNCKATSQSSHSFSDSVVLGLPLEDIEQEYCFSVTASNGSFTTIVEGMFKNGIAIVLNLG